jgi:hypothetical protein
MSPIDRDWAGDWNENGKVEEVLISSTNSSTKYGVAGKLPVGNLVTHVLCPNSQGILLCTRNPQTQFSCAECAIPPHLFFTSYFPSAWISGVERGSMSHL